jgi:small-conductance mechanosensitive channel
MASVGGIGVAVGLATQSVATNVVSALSLFASRPFVVGDRVQLMKGGAVVVEGKVEHIEPMRTVLRDPEGNPSE